jgi:hypothetical protein
VLISSVADEDEMDLRFFCVFLTFVLALADKATAAEDPVRLCKSTDPEDRKFSLFVLRYQSDQFAVSDISEVLRRLLVDSDAAISCMALEVIPFLPFQDESKGREVCRDVRETIQRKTTDSDQNIAFAAKVALVKVNKGALADVEFERWLTSSIVPSITSLSKSDDKSKERAAQLLGAAGSYGDIATPDLIERLLGSQSTTVVSATFDALRRIVPVSQHTRDILVSKSVAESLARLEKHDDEFIRHVARQLRIAAQPLNGEESAK